MVVYVTGDEGQYPVEAATETPVAEPRGTVKAGVLVQLPKVEVVHRFYMVVKSGDEPR